MIVVDTHVVIWLGHTPEMLSKNASAAVALARSQDGIAISGVTLYEIAWLATRGRVEIDSLDAFLAETEASFIVLPIRPSIARIAAELPEAYPGDPMDRIIGATAIDYGVPLVTKDRVIRASGALKAIW